MKFLLVEDDESLAGAIEQLLAKHHYVMDLATDGMMGRDMAEAFPYDLILLDWTLPKLDGITLCKYLRNEGNYTPIILLTARDGGANKVIGLDAGADDYLVKPFGFEELLARIRALLRRAEGIVSPVLQWGDLCLDPRSSEVTCRGTPISVTPKEYALLELFLRNPNRIFSLDNLLDKVWPFDDTPNVGSVRTHIKGLRQKLKKGGLPEMIATVYGLGYRLKPADFAKLPSETPSETPSKEKSVKGDSDPSMFSTIPSPTASSVTVPSPTMPAPTMPPMTVPPSGVAPAASVKNGAVKNGARSQAAPQPKSPQPKSSQSATVVRAGKLDLSALWQGVSDTYTARVKKVASTLRGLQPGLIEPTVKKQLLAEAHVLAGSLGSFGFQSATTNCREIEGILQANAYLSVQHIRQLETFITRVQASLEQGLDKGHTTSKTSAVAELAHPQSRPVSPMAIELRPGQHFQLLMVNASNDRDERWLLSLSAIATHYQMQVTAIESIAEAREIIFGEQRLDTTQPASTAVSLNAVSLNAGPPNIVLFDFAGSEQLPENNSPEFTLLADCQAARPAIPTIVLTTAASFENRVRVARLGVTVLLQTPATPTEVLEAAAQVLQQGAPPAAKLLVVDDDPAMLTLLQDTLQPWGFRLQLLSSPQQFWQTLERFEPDLLLLDVSMPEINGFDLCQVIRSAPRWQEMPVLFMSGYSDAETIQQVFSVGADDYIRKPIIAPELVARVLGWLNRARTRRLRADVDSLTGIANRQKSTQLLTRMLGLAKRQGETLCFAVVDFDHFKQVNDQYGHPMGDRVLRRFGERLRETFRTEDVVGRWGGEEFVVGLYGINREEGTERLRTFLQTWQQETFIRSELGAVTDAVADAQPSPETLSSQRAAPTFKMTFTAGVAMYPQDGTALQELYRAADEALYHAKAAGRNRIFSGG
ncbi:MAG: response regulator [Cyanobacteria bacterium J06597_16]